MINKKTIVTYQTIFCEDIKKEEFDIRILAVWFFEDLKNNKLIKNVNIEVVND